MFKEPIGSPKKVLESMDVPPHPTKEDMDEINPPDNSNLLSYPDGTVRNKNTMKIIKNIDLDLSKGPIRAYIIERRALPPKIIRKKYKPAR